MTTPTRTARMFARLAAATLVVAASATASLAENTKLRFAYLLSDTVLPVMVAKKAGAYEKAGIDLEMTEVQGGPAVVAAIASGEADIGYSAPVPPINARLNGVNVKMVLAMGHEVEPDKKFIWMVASKASGAKTLADLKGKKISFNANGALCELAWRDHLAAAGMSIEDVESVVLPFPQAEAALEQGSIDAACTINPFYYSITSNANIGATVLATGMLADEKEPVLSDVIFASDDYVAANEAAIKAFAKITGETRKALVADQAALEAAAVEFMGLTAESAKGFRLSMLRDDMTISDADAQKILDAMHRTGLISSPATATDFVKNLAE